jgi:ubiquitin carboxyl-terminal hydrolase 8
MQGLQNLGSTCAINSMIQIICRTNYLRNAVLNNNIVDDTITYQLKEILDMMHNKNHSLSPRKFITHLYKHFDGIFQQGEQLDIGELWMFLFDKIASECGTPISPDIIELTYTDEQNNIEEIDLNGYLTSCYNLKNKCNNTINKINNNKTSEWLLTSQGIMLNMIKCSACNNIIYNFEPFTAIPLDIPDDNTKPSLASMLRTYLKTQECNDDWKCEKCDKCTPYIKSTKLWKMPPVLMFVIKRFSNMTMKNNKGILINDKLNIKKGSMIADINEEFKYTCSGMALHYGGLSGGHYCAMCNINEENESKQKWILYDDINMTVINDTKNYFESNRDAYMIVYSKS